MFNPSRPIPVVFLIFSAFCAGTVRAAKVAKPSFNKAHGFYSSSFSVRITSSTSGAAIRYTTDGSKPTASYGSTLSNGGSVTISTTTPLRAVGYKSGMTTSDCETRTYIFLSHVLTQTRPADYPTHFGYSPHLAAYLPSEYGMVSQVVQDNQSTIKEDLQDIPTMSVVMKRDEMFGASGVYMTGDGVSGLNSDYERSCSVELIYPGKTKFAGFAGFQIDCGIRPHTHMKGKRFFKFVFRTERGPKKLYYPVFETALHGADTAVSEFDRLVLRAGGNDSWQGNGVSCRDATFTKDQWVRASQLEMKGYGARGTFVHLYINGLYWGLYNLAERPDAWFCKAYWGGTKEQWTALHHKDNRTTLKHVLVSGNDSRWKYLHNTLVASQTLAQSAKYNELQQYLDVLEFADYIVLHSVAGSGDWPHNNWFAGYRYTPTPEPARYFAWDLEDSWVYTTEGTPEQPKPRSNEGAWIHPFLYGTWNQIGRLWVEITKNADFKMLFADRIYKHCFNGGALTEENCLGRWNAINAQIDRAIVGESARWGRYHNNFDPKEGVTVPYTFTRSHWLNKVNVVRGFMSGNSQQMVNAARARGLYPSNNPPLYSKHGGSVASGFRLTITRNNGSGTIFYRTDGQDPRNSGGSIRSGSSSSTGSPVVTINSSLTLNARVKNGSTWSALANAKFTVVSASPEIAVSSTSISTSCTQGQNASSKSFEVWNSGGGTLQYKTVEYSSTLSVSPTTGSSTGSGDKKSHTINFTTSGLSAGTHNKTITVEDNGSGASNGPITVNITITVNPPAPEPAIAVSTTSIAVSCEEGQDAPDATIQVWNAGTGTLQYKLVEYSSKLSIAPTTGSSNGATDKQTHTIAFSTATMAAGTQTRTFTVEDNGSGAVNGPITVTITITVTQPVPAAPSGFAAAAVSATEVRLTWNDLPDETRYMLRKSLDGSYWYAFDAVYPDADHTSYTDTGLNPETTYYYKVRGINDGGSGPYCQPVSVTTPPAVVPELAVSTTSIAVSCVAGEDAPDATIRVWNAGTGTLQFRLVEATSKLDVVPASGVSTGSTDKQTHAVDFHTASLAPGVYDRQFTVEDDGSGAENGPITVAVRITVVQPLDGTPFTAYNDLAWASGQLAQNIATYSQGESGLLVDHETGALLPVGLSVMLPGTPILTQGANAAAGTEAAGIFGGIVDCAGLIGYQTNALVLSLSGLDPAMRYELVLFGNRAVSGYTARTTALRLDGADSFANASSAGAVLSTDAHTDDTTTIANGYNTMNGYVARYAQIACGADGAISVYVPAFSGTGDAGRYYLNALRLRAGPGPETLVAKGATWRFRKGTAEASSPPTAWRAGPASFDDSGWPAGPAPFGYSSNVEEGPFGTELADMKGNYCSVFLRREFTLGDPHEIAELVLNAEFDDGFIAWINGREVARVHMNSEPGTFVACDDVYAPGSSTEPQPVSVSLSGGDLPALAERNVLAVQVFNYTRSSSDLVFDLALTAARGALSTVQDDDGNGMADDWETLHLAALPAADQSDTADPDGDGLLNIEEYWAGTAPDSAASTFAVDLTLGAAGLQVSFATLLAEGDAYAGMTRHYQLQQRADMSAAGQWLPVPGCEDVEATGAPFVLTVSAPNAGTCYRARVWLE